MALKFAKVKIKEEKEDEQETKRQKAYSEAGEAVAGYISKKKAESQADKDAQTKAVSKIDNKSKMTMNMTKPIKKLKSIKEAYA